jgi:hypothetical protein
MCLYDEREIKQVLEQSGLSKKMARVTVDDVRGGWKVTTASAEEQYEVLYGYALCLERASRPNNT